MADNKSAASKKIDDGEHVGPPTVQSTTEATPSPADETSMPNELNRINEQPPGLHRRRRGTVDWLVEYHAATQSHRRLGRSTRLSHVDGRRRDRPLRRPDFTQVTIGDTVEVISSSASDTQNCTIEARKADGTIVSETLALTGTTAKIFAGNGAIDRILKVELASVAIGTITVRKSVAGATFRTIPVGERGFSMIFRKGRARPAGTVNYYAKFFWKNTNATNALLSAQVSESADPSGTITHGLAASVNDSGTTTNRQTAPGGVTFAGTAANVPWYGSRRDGRDRRVAEHDVGDEQRAIRSTYTSALSGSTT
jgi:hypothetical protein